MYHCRAKSLLVVLLSVLCYHVSGQTSISGSNPRNGRENNPYSKYGLGEIRNGNNTVLKGMGNITSAFCNPTQANTDNPASYSFIRRTTFEVGANTSSRTVHGTVNGVDESYKTGTASVAYMNLAFPVGKNGGMCLGFRPYSSTYYKLEDSINSSSTPPSPFGSAVTSYNGEGGMNFAFIGGSAKYKGLSVGFNAGYLFGTFRNVTAIYPKNVYATNYAFSAEFNQYSRLGGIHWKGGLLYEAKLDSFHVLRIGATATLGQKLNEHFRADNVSTFGYGDTLVRDTLYASGDIKGKLALPMSYSAGIMLTRTGKWGVGVDYTATQWNAFHSELNTQMNANIASSSYKMSIGGEYTPNADNTKRYLSRATYRLGGYYGSDYLQIQGQKLPYYGLTAGLSLPFKRSMSQVHIALDGGVLGTTANNLMKQNYIRLSLGVSLNDLWFVKRRYE